MNVDQHELIDRDQYELIDRIDKTISDISRNERINRDVVLGCLEKGLEYQLRRVKAKRAVGWFNNGH